VERKSSCGYRDGAIPAIEDIMGLAQGTRMLAATINWLCEAAQGSVHSGVLTRKNSRCVRQAGRLFIQIGALPMQD
jgi:hypothetical protein